MNNKLTWAELPFETKRLIKLSPRMIEDWHRLNQMHIMKLKIALALMIIQKTLTKRG